MVEISVEMRGGFQRALTHSLALSLLSPFDVRLAARASHWVHWRLKAGGSGQTLVKLKRRHFTLETMA